MSYEFIPYYAGNHLVIDATLTKEGYAADAKATGDRIRLIEETIADMNYEAIIITRYSANPSSVERGSSVDDVVLSWATSRTPTTLTLESESIDTNVTSKTIIGPFTGTTSWTLKATDERGATATKTATIWFFNGIYYGAAAEPSTYDSTFVLGLTKILQNSYLTGFTADAGDDEYIYYCLPVRMGTRSFKVGGFDGGFSLIDTISFTNASGYTEDYYIYRSDNAALGDTYVTVT